MEHRFGDEPTSITSYQDGLEQKSYCKFGMLHNRNGYTIVFNNKKGQSKYYLYNYELTHDEFVNYNCYSYYEFNKVMKKKEDEAIANSKLLSKFEEMKQAYVNILGNVDLQHDSSVEMKIDEVKQLIYFVLTGTDNLHRINQPAQINLSAKYIAYYQNGNHYFDDEIPFRTTFEGKQAWKNSKGEFSRSIGPAIIWEDGIKEYWFNGKHYPKICSDEQWKKELRLSVFE